MRTALLFGGLLLGVLVAGCASDALYTVCDDPAQCGSRTIREDGEEYEVDLECVQVTVMVALDRTTDGAFCTLACTSDADCDDGGCGEATCDLETARCVTCPGPCPCLTAPLLDADFDSVAAVRHQATFDAFLQDEVDTDWADARRDTDG